MKREKIRIFDIKWVINSKFDQIIQKYIHSNIVYILLWKQIIIHSETALNPNLLVLSNSIN